MTEHVDPIQEIATADVAAAPTSPVEPLPQPAPAAAATGTRRGPRPPGLVLRTAGGVGAVGVKELRGRMRGRRAFVILSGYSSAPSPRTRTPR